MKDKRQQKSRGGGHQNRAGPGGKTRRAKDGKPPRRPPGPKPTAPAGRTPERGPSKADASLNGMLWLYGRHAVAAALANPARKIRRVLATKNALEWLKQNGGSIPPSIMIDAARPEEIDELLKEGAVHQGLAALVEPLRRVQIEDACTPAETGRPVLILDQITDPQNIGALFRSAAAFGARAVIVQDRRTPPLAGALAKAAAGAIEKIPCVEVVNIARAIEELQSIGYFCAGLAGEAEAEITALPAAPLALVMGAEGDGLRRLVAQKCDQLFRIPIHAEMESLNVSTAAAITLYEAQRSR